MTHDGVTAVLDMWVVYDHPTDFPANYIARRWYIVPNEDPIVSREIIPAAELDDLRYVLDGMGLSQLAHMDNDDPVIIETWL